MASTDLHLHEAMVHVEAAQRWLDHAQAGDAPLELALRMHLYHRLRAVGWLIGAPPFT